MDTRRFVITTEIKSLSALSRGTGSGRGVRGLQQDIPEPREKVKELIAREGWQAYGCHDNADQSGSLRLRSGLPTLTRRNYLQIAANHIIVFGVIFPVLSAPRAGKITQKNDDVICCYFRR
jgi:hypothetical protein